jgi:cellulose synthase/poly-beta-1,6-N-acetylglucosamine synthase-like glycosyltransferase
MVYLLLMSPFVLAYFSWQYFPQLATWIATALFLYHSTAPPASLLWYSAICFFYTWYTFLAIGVAGFWAVAATFARTKQNKSVKLFKPWVSLIIPAYNEENNVARCITSLFECTEKYDGNTEIIVVDDGSTDQTYEIAWSTIAFHKQTHPRTRARVIRHTANQGKIEAIKTGLNTTLGGFVGIVDADSWWSPSTLRTLVDYMLLNGKKAVTGYVHPSDGSAEQSSYVILQQLEYSQGLGVARCAQSIGNNVLVVSGAISLYDAENLRRILDEKAVKSVTEDLEITLEMHKRGEKVGYVNAAVGSTIVPTSLRVLWNQRVRWFQGWLHNVSDIHQDLLTKRTWLSLLLWYSYIFEYSGAFIDIAALIAFPFLWWFAPDGILFGINIIIFGAYSFLVGVINQAIALKYAYGSVAYKSLLIYTPFYPFLWLINMFARLASTLKFALGSNGKWHPRK